MKWLIDDLYELMEFDEESFDFYDLYDLLKTPHKITFDYEDEAYSIESGMEGDECVVNFNGKWFIAEMISLKMLLLAITSLQLSMMTCMVLR